MVNYNELKSILLEIGETTQTMVDNIDNESVLKFFAGKLSLLVKQVVVCLAEKN